MVKVVYFARTEPIQCHEPDDDDALSSMNCSRLFNIALNRSLRSKYLCSSIALVLLLLVHPLRKRIAYRTMQRMKYPRGNDGTGIFSCAAL